MVVTVALVVGGILLFDDDADAPADTVAPDVTPTVAAQDEETVPATTRRPSRRAAATTPATEAPPVDEVPAVLSFSAAEAAGLEVEWGERCDTTTGRLAVVDYFASECYARFTGDNGGETEQGVTGSTVKIVSTRGPRTTSSSATSPMRCRSTRPTSRRPTPSEA